MKSLRATMLAAVCALTAVGSTSAPLVDVERSDIHSIVVVTPTTDPPAARETSEASQVIDVPATTTTSTTEPATTTSPATTTTTTTTSAATTTTTVEVVPEGTALVPSDNTSTVPLATPPADRA